MVLGNQPTNRPTRKVVSSGTWAAVASIISWADDAYFHDKIPGYIEVAFIVVATSLAGYLTRNSAPDAPPEPLVVPEDGAGD